MRPIPKKLPFVTLLLLLVMGCVNNIIPTGEAEVSIDGIDPVGGYPGVEITVDFTIVPGENTRENGMQWSVNFGDGTKTTGDGVSGSATHSYERAGQYDVEVSAVFGGKTVGSAVEPVRIFSPVDLVISESAGSPVNAQAGGELQISFTVANTTAAEVYTAYEVQAFLSSSPAVDADVLETLTPLGTTTVEPDAIDEPIIGSGEQRNTAFTGTIPADLPSGDYHVVTWLDPRGRINDTDIDNNIDVSGGIVRVENLADQLPDVCVRNLLVTPDRAFPQLNSVTRVFSLCNDGGADAFDIVHKTYLSIGDDVLDSDDLLIDESEPLNVFPNDSQDIGPDQIVLGPSEVVTPTGGQDVEVYVIVTAASTDAQQEDADESNQIIVSNPILVTDEPVDGPDIVVEEFSVSPESTFLNGTLQIDTKISNQGTIDVGSFFCGIYLGAAPFVDTDNDPRLTNINIPSLGAGDATEVTMPVTVPGLYEPGVYHFYIVCDPLNSLSEPFRSNNAFVYGSPITITDEADVDLLVESISVPSNVNEGEEFEVVVTACVQGSNPSGQTVARLYSNSGTQVDFNAAPTIEFDVPNILPGAENCLDIPLIVTASCRDFESEYVFGVQLDYDGRLPELDESNNRKSAPGAVNVDGPFCSCPEDALEPNDRPIDAVPLFAGVTDAAICTAGNCDYYGVDLAAGESLVVTNTFETDKGLLHTTLFDTSGLQILASNGTPDRQEVATFLVQQAGRYIFRICGATATARNLYSLDVQVLPQSAGVDVLPRNLTLPAGDSFSLGAVLDVSLRGYNLGVMPAGPFEARFIISSNQVFGDGDDIPLSNQNISGIAAGSFQDLSAQVPLPTSLGEGTYWLGVQFDPTGALAETDSTNNIAISRSFEVKTECFDALEPNNGFATARAINGGSYSNLQACTLGDDYYKLCLPTGKRFDVTITFADADGDIDLQLLNDQNVRIASSEQAGSDVEQVSWDFVNGDQCFFVRVYMPTPQPVVETTYSMQVNVSDVDPALLCDSLFEPNDSFATASSFLAASGVTAQLDRCPAADTDFYAVTLAAGQTVSLTASKVPGSQSGTLRLQLYKPNQTPGPNIETAPGIPDATISNYVAPQDGTYFVQITVGGNTRNVSYELSATGLGGIDLLAHSLTIGPGTYVVGDEVRLAFEITNLLADVASMPPYEVFFGSAPTHDPVNDISLGMFTASDVAGNATVAANQRVDVPMGASAGTRYLHVVVDPADTLSDTNLGNNIATTPIEIVP